MKATLLVFLGGFVMLSSSAIAGPVTCQSVLSVGAGSFDELVAVGACDIGDVTFSGFNTSLTATNLLVSTDGGVGSGIGTLLGLSYTYTGGSFPGGTIGYTATFDPTEGVGCPVAYSSCGITSLETQLLALAAPTNLAAVNVVYSGGYVGTANVNALNTNNETLQVLIPQTSSVTKVATYNGLGSISSFQSDVNTGGINVAPEPTTFGLVGGALLGLGFLGRKKISRQ
jgi:hypothetical protein